MLSQIQPEFWIAIGVIALMFFGAMCFTIDQMIGGPK
jgi:hypothetical protein